MEYSEGKLLSHIDSEGSPERVARLVRWIFRTPTGTHEKHGISVLVSFDETLIACHAPNGCIQTYK